jgi:hypothetical protein
MRRGRYMGRIVGLDAGGLLAQWEPPQLLISSLDKTNPVITAAGYQQLRLTVTLSSVLLLVGCLSTVRVRDVGGRP